MILNNSSPGRRLAPLVRTVFVEVVGLLTVGTVAVALRAGTAGWLVAAGVWVGTLAAIANGKIRVPRHRRPTDLAWLAVEVGLVAAATVLAGLGVAAIWGAAGVGALVSYQQWYARQHRPSARIEVGRSLPPFTLERLDGSVVPAAEVANGPAVLVFYRGAWCPFCVVQIEGLAAQYRELDRRGVAVRLISPQPADDTAGLAERFDVPMDFLVDRDGVAMRTLDLVQRGGVPLTYRAGGGGEAVSDTVVPTVVIVDSEGVVVWVRHEADHRERPDPVELLRIIDEAVVGVASRS